MNVSTSSTRPRYNILPPVDTAVQPSSYSSAYLPAKPPGEHELQVQIETLRGQMRQMRGQIQELRKLVNMHRVDAENKRAECERMKASWQKLAAIVDVEGIIDSERNPVSISSAFAELSKRLDDVSTLENELLQKVNEIKTVRRKIEDNLNPIIMKDFNAYYIL
ncbi:hypothetical protein AJ78_07967 [Emergomyces pasteurianus Ep9510]|uniref:Uncharacterized protein n=1 Tax=Emergomyces pasteurianus Ep9510 TaxID=1447872 RepID=A0A1J9Q5L6_9EURO|nr:hypothetical protein AJ78_07967 [Emergomyces pasteurianus Ep9510]